MTENSVFLCPAGPHADLHVDPDVEASEPIFTVGDAAENIKTSTTTIKRVAAELRLNIKRTIGGIALLSPQQVERIRAELERRQREAWK